MEAAAIDSIPKDLFIGGEWLPATAGATLSVEDPATGRALAEVADASVADARAALAAAADAQASWRTVSPRERAGILRRAFDEMAARRDELALVLTLEMGKPLKEARAEVAYAADFLLWFAEEAVRINGRHTSAPDGNGRLLVTSQPVGPCVLITPWNFPLAMGARKIAPAIAAGCTMVVKPARQTPLSMLALADILARAGLPPGVLNHITTTASAEVIGALLGDERARKVSFTGSTDVGRSLVEQAARQLLRISMELGGNAPFIRVRGRRLGCCRPRRDRRQDAQRWGGLHRGEPLLRS